MLRSPHRFWKGDGTGNDFVVVCDLDDQLHLADQHVAALCDRISGIGADGFLRVVRGTHLHGSDAGIAEFFMDYRNADGSVAEMCGNGVRVFAQFLLEQGLIQAGVHQIGTRAGLITVKVGHDDNISVDMGVAEILSDDLSVLIADRAYPDAVAVLMPNPHAVVITDDDPGTLAVSPTHSPASVFPDGVNYEFIRVLAPGHIAMRVYERGVGETKSCGTGACAAAAVAVRTSGAPGAWTMRVDVPGGRLQVSADEQQRLRLQGPAHITQTGTFTIVDLGGGEVSVHLDDVALTPSNAAHLSTSADGAQ